ncbi:Hint domain-containing protein [Actinacidiphila glaucinigra]|uniref:Hint domain-containing protein n=1 Tax=Actinacidiphila glaucinigra TaxID=235986 RepID=UPI0036732A72
MTRQGPQKYPGASRRYWYQDDYGGDAMEVNALVLHTTEGRSVPTYGGGGSAPNLTAKPDFEDEKLVWYQHFDIDISSRALVNRPGGVETNTLNVCQVELVGTCDPERHEDWGAANRHIYWPKAPQWALRELAEFLAWMHTHHGVPLKGPKLWLPYPRSYGNAGGQRMTGREWNAFRGVCGHQHVPENCVHPDTPVLRADLSWARAAELAVGDEIACFDEEDAEDAEGAEAGRGRRRLRRGVVTRNDPARKDAYRVTTARGEVVATADHPWLVRLPHGDVWVTSRELTPFKHRIVALADRQGAPAGAWEGAVVAEVTGEAEVLAVEPLGEQPIASLSTSTRTYVARGLLCHNSHGDPGALDFAKLLEYARSQV